MSKVAERMESLVKLNSGRNGRDKIFRAAQYALKLVNSFQVKEGMIVQYNVQF